MRRSLAITISSAFIASSLVGITGTTATAAPNPVQPDQFGLHVPEIAEVLTQALLTDQSVFGTRASRGVKCNSRRTSFGGMA